MTPPGERFWKKIVTWRMRKKWYAQSSWYDYEPGEAGSILSEYIEASPWLGPHTTKEEAIEAAKKHLD